MSQNLYVGLSKNQLQKLIDGEEVGKRPYVIGDMHFSKHQSPTSKKYEGNIRLFIRILSDEEAKEEAEGAFF